MRAPSRTRAPHAMPPKKRPLAASNATGERAPRAEPKRAERAAVDGAEPLRRFDANGRCPFPLKELLRENVHLAGVHQTLRERERESRALMRDLSERFGRAEERENAINGVVMDEPMQSDAPGEACDIDKHCFWLFILRLIDASCSGSTGGDAYRISLVLNAALDDVKLAKRTPKKQFEKLFAFTRAINDCGVLDRYIDRGMDPHKFFANLARQWREILSEEGQTNAKAAGVADEDFSSAKRWCDSVKRYLESGDAGTDSVFGNGPQKIKFDYEPTTSKTTKRLKR